MYPQFSPTATTPSPPQKFENFLLWITQFADVRL
jgi:hypothetical protein